MKNYLVDHAKLEVLHKIAKMHPKAEIDYTLTTLDELWNKEMQKLKLKLKK